VVDITSAECGSLSAAVELFPPMEVVPTLIADSRHRRPHATFLVIRIILDIPSVSALHRHRDSYIQIAAVRLSSRNGEKIRDDAIEVGP